MNILLVEDDVRIADFLDRGLRAEGHRVKVARNGPDGLAMARDAARTAAGDATPTVMLLDVMLPGMSGLEVCQTLRAMRVHLPILMLTALGTLEDRVSGLRLGADDYLVKPFEFEELLARIDALARRGHQQMAAPAMCWWWPISSSTPAPCAPAAPAAPSHSPPASWPCWNC